MARPKMQPQPLDETVTTSEESEVTVTEAVAPEAPKPAEPVEVVKTPSGLTIENF